MTAPTLDELLAMLPRARERFWELTMELESWTAHLNRVEAQIAALRLAQGAPAPHPPGDVPDQQK